MLILAPEPPDPRGSHLAIRRADGDHAACCSRGVDRRHRRFSRWEIRPGGAALHRRVDGDAGAVVVADDHVADGPWLSADHSRSRFILRRHQFQGGAQCRHRHQGERQLPGSPGGWNQQEPDLHPPCAAQYYASDHHSG